MLYKVKGESKMKAFSQEILDFQITLYIRSETIVLLSVIVIRNAKICTGCLVKQPPHDSNQLSELSNGCLLLADDAVPVE